MDYNRFEIQEIVVSSPRAWILVWNRVYDIFVCSQGSPTTRFPKSRDVIIDTLVKHWDWVVDMPHLQPKNNRNLEKIQQESGNCSIQGSMFDSAIIWDWGNKYRKFGFSSSINIGWL